MIHELYTIVKDRLTANGVPARWEFGPTPIDNVVGGTRIQMFRDMAAGDIPGPARKTGPLATKTAASRAQSAVVQIHAQSTIEGAQLKDHQRLADMIADQVHVALIRCANASKNILQITRMGLVDLPGTPESWRGAQYEIRFTLERPVRETKWTGESIPTGSPGKTKTTINATGGGSSIGLPSATTATES